MPDDNAEERCERQHHLDAESGTAVVPVACLAQGEDERDPAQREAEIGIDCKQPRRNQAGVAPGERRE